MSHTLSIYLFIATGGAVGACLRFFCTGLVDSWFGKALPFGTLAVNIIGSFLLAVLYGFIEKHGYKPDKRLRRGRSSLSLSLV